MANRQEVTTLLEKMLTGQSAKRILLLKATSNSGKTHLLAELKAYAKDLRLAHSSVDCKGGPPLEEVVSLLHLDLRRAASLGASPYSHLIGELLESSRPVLLSFDTYEQASLSSRTWIENQLLPRLDTSSGVVVVVAGKQTPERAKQSWAALAADLQLEPIQRAADWLDYSRRKWHSQVNLDHIEALTLATRGDPGQLSALLETMMSGLQARAGA